MVPLNLLESQLYHQYQVLVPIPSGNVFLRLHPFQYTDDIHPMLLHQYNVIHHVLTLVLIS